jgi:hypothetical protein
MPVSKKCVSSSMFFFAVIALCAAALAGCNSGAPPPGDGSNPADPSGDSTVTVIATSTANDQLFAYGATITSIVLTNKTGTPVSLYTSPSAGSPPVFGMEWMHLNGAAEPFTTATIPNGTYTSAAITISGCYFTQVTAAQGMTTSTEAEGTCSEGAAAATVNLAAPIVITGNATALLLDLQVSSSWTIASPGMTSTQTVYTIDPTFTLSTIALSAQPSNLNNGLISGLHAEITSVDLTKNTIDIQMSAGAMATLHANMSTVYQGAIAQLSDVTTNLEANLDVAIQEDGSLLATRVEVDDASEPYVDTQYGTFLNTSTQVTAGVVTDPIGCPDNAFFNCDGLYQFLPQTHYDVSLEFANVAQLPFTATFNAATYTPGQYTSAIVTNGGGTQNLPVAKTIMLEPQTLNGVVQSVTNQNGFAVYTVSLAPYDVFVAPNAYNPAPTPLTSPQTVTVYADTSTQFLHAAMIETGDTLRFRGVVFNDGGTLRMDCDAVLDGVTE